MPVPKFCNDCNQEKDSSLFAFANSRTGQLRPQCKPCTTARERSRFEARRLADGVKPDHKTCSKCDQTKPFTPEFFKRRVNSKHGLTAECKSCLIQRNAEWIKTEAGKALAGRARAKNVSKMAVYARAYQAKNRKKISAYVQSWREKNREHCRALDAAWARKNKAKRTEYRHTRRARGPFNYSIVPALKASQKGKCAICRDALASFVEVDHIMPVALGGTNESSNLQLLCRSCNRSKGAKHPVDYMQSRGFLL